MLQKSKRIIALLLAAISIFLSFGIFASAKDPFDNSCENTYAPADIVIEASTPTKPSNVDTNTASKRLANLYSKLEGKYFTTTGGAACGAKSSGHSCSNCKLSNIITKSWFKNLFGTISSTSLFPKTYYSTGKAHGPDGWSCFCFATFAEWYVYADYNTDQVTTTNIGTYNYNYDNASKYLRIGDVIRTGTTSRNDTHSSIVVSWDSTGVTVLDSNWVGDYNCKVAKHTIKYSYSNKFTISRATNSTTAPAKAPTITLTSPATGVRISVGKTLGVWGTVYPNGASTKITGKIIRLSDNEVMYTYTTTTSSNYDLKSSTLNDEMKFSKLAEGVYKFVITASNSKGSAEKTVNPIYVGNAKLGNPPVVEIKDTRVSPKLTKFETKNTTTLVPKIKTDSGVKITSTKWSSNNKYVTVDQKGNVTALALPDGGTSAEATITCNVTDSNGNTGTGTCVVKVGFSFWEWIMYIFLFGWAWYK